MESTARFAYEFGFQQVFAEDAMSDRSAEAHVHAVEFILKRIGRVRKTSEILDALAWPPAGPDCGSSLEVRGLAYISAKNDG